MPNPMPSIRPVDPDVVRGEAIPMPRERALRIRRRLLEQVIAVGLAAVACMVFAGGRVPLWYWAALFGPAAVVVAVLDVRRRRRTSA